MTETPWRDPTSNGNDPRYRTGATCVLCNREPAGTAWSPYFCQRCNAERIDRITRNLEEMAGKKAQ